MELITVINFSPSFYKYYNLFFKTFIFDHPLMINMNCVDVTNPFNHEGDEFLNLGLKRWEYMLDCLNKNLTIMFLDVDIIIKRSYKNIVLDMLKDYDVIFQDNDSYYNIGCMAIQPNDRTISFCTKVIEKFKSTKGIDQILVNELLKNIDLKIGKFGIEFYSNHLENYKYPNYIPEKCILFHATNTYTIDEKYNLMLDAIDRIK